MDKNTLLSSFGKWVSPIFSKSFLEDLASSTTTSMSKS